MGNELKRIEAWTGFQANNYNAQPCEDGPFYYADEVDEILTRLRAELEEAKTKIERLTARGIEDLKHSLAEAEAERDTHKARADEAEALLLQIRETVDDSNGIDGWHLNGDIASWGEFDWYEELQDLASPGASGGERPANSCGADQSLADPPTLTAADARRNMLEPSRPSNAEGSGA